MKPLKLTMQAFGTYAKVQEIDFTKLDGRSIFVITGKTGSGKTTIFDAICFALYGEASGSSREKDTLRSDFASGDVVSFVELEFQISDKTYYIKREPRQIRNKQRGTGTKEYEPTAELHLPSGKTITGVKNVDEEIKGVMGIDKNQFRQIVMLPQGEFRKLLEANSVSREEILRKLFGTNAFLSFQNKLKDKRKALYSERKTLKEGREECISSIKGGSDEVLSQMVEDKSENISEIVIRTEDVIKEDNKLLGVMKEKHNELSTSKEKLQKRISESEFNNKKLIERDELKSKKDSMEKRKEEFEEKKGKIEKARKALVILEVEKSCEEKSLSKKKREAEREVIVKKLEDTCSLYEKSKVDLEKEKEKESTKKELEKQGTILKSYVDKIVNYENIKLNEANIQKHLVLKQEEMKKIKNAIEEAKKQVSQLSKEHGEAVEAGKMYIKLQSELENKNKLRDKMLKVYKSNDNLIKKQGEHSQKADEFSKIENKYKEIKLKYENMDTLFRKGQAGILASNLEEESPCPVCGSTEHPCPAKLLQDVPREDELKEIKDIFDNIQKEYNTRLNNLSKLKGTIDEMNKSLNEEKAELALDIGNEIISLHGQELLDSIKKTGSKISGEIKDLETKVKEVELKKSKEKDLEDQIKTLNEKSIPEAENQLQNINNEYTKLFGEHESIKSSKDNIEKEIPEDIRSKKALDEKIDKVEKDIHIIESSIKKAQEQYEKLSNMKTTAETELNAKKNQIVEAEKVLESAKDELRIRLKAQGFENYKEYADSKISEEDIANLDNDIKKFYEGLNTISQNYDKMVKETEKILYIDIANLNKEFEDMKSEENNLNNQEKVIYSRHEINKEQLKKLKKFNKHIDEKDEKISVIEELTKAATGDNPLKLSFERYVLAAYFDDIINAANVRLNKMAGGRFLLRRKRQKGKGNSQQGLEMEVLDNYTGKYRNVSTVSGGEGFKASLSLALGLADVVQSNAGGINLETMFVDEGFGTLDPESLDNAVQTLLDLQSGGRIVGIISHVPELKERVEARLEVTQTKEGSFAEFNI